MHLSARYCMWGRELGGNKGGMLFAFRDSGTVRDWYAPGSVSESAAFQDPETRELQSFLMCPYLWQNSCQKFLPFSVLKLGSGGQSSKIVGLHITEWSDSLIGAEYLIFVVIMNEIDTVRFS